MIDRCDIAVLGAGPAGCIAAAGLVRLGFKVAMITAARRIETWEGISARAVETLRSAGLNTAISKLEGEVVRQAHWNGFSTAANRERIVNRLDFDEALQADVVGSLHHVIERHDIDGIVAAGGQRDRHIARRAQHQHHHQDQEKIKAQ